MRLGRHINTISLRLVAVAALALVAGCAKVDLSPHLQPLSKDTLMLLGKKGMEVPAPMFIRIFKQESELEVWKKRSDGRFYHFKTYPICNWSGEIGPKVKQGDKQAPEGFYKVARNQMNPNSQFYLAFNLGYPNAFDKANKRTGDSLMVHGKCKSAGCYAMTDALIEEIYALARESYIGGQDAIEVHAMPFRMTDVNMARHAKHQWFPFWQTLKQGYDHFEQTRLPPDVAVCQRQYVVNVKLPGGQNVGRIDPEGVCPTFERPKPEAFVALADGTIGASASAKKADETTAAKAQ
jgi:murein L,D-transpeptidase YafK